MKLCPSEADIHPVSGREHHVSDYLLTGIEGCGDKDQACLFLTHHDDCGWCGYYCNHGVYCGYYWEYGDCLSHTVSMLWGDWRVCTFETLCLLLAKRVFSKTYPQWSLYPLVSIQWLSNSYKHDEYYPVDNLCPIQAWLSEHPKGRRLVLCEPLVIKTHNRSRWLWQKQTDVNKSSCRSVFCLYFCATIDTNELRGKPLKYGLSS